MTSPVDAATERLLDTADRLPDAGWTAPSECAGWSRAHVLAHVALNAEGLAGAVRGVVGGPATPMYRSDEARDADIAELAAEPPDVVRARLRSAAALFAEAVTGLTSVAERATFERTPGGRVMPAAAVPLLRLREVEIHHADLLAGYTSADWPEETVVTFLDAEAGRPPGQRLVARATDLGRDWRLGDPGSDDPVVSGPGHALAWWLTGRRVPVGAGGAVLSCSTGPLPTMEGR
ncbi:MAG TPA: maleylpyruvate isomerase family mycothiol-dependent enzyme [Nocardioides sp.]|nr:maleylpyruvate isomerase family mycothiol-dependent enzyme [Nocardioides sp.]